MESTQVIQTIKKPRPARPSPEQNKALSKKLKEILDCAVFLPHR